MELSADVAIDIKKLTKTYPGRVAVDNISFSVKKGSVHGFLGPNGAGKSTTMKILSGLIKESDGSFTINGKVGFLPEHPPVYPNMTVKDYLMFVFSIYAPQKKNAESAVVDVMNKTGLMSVTGRLIGNLSKGYQQRVGIAQALVHNPEIIILDEPTVGLDPLSIAEIRELIASLKKDHTILFSTHQLHDVELLCSDITLINHGKIVVSGALDNILRNLKTHTTLYARVQKFSEEDKTEMMRLFSLGALEVTLDIEQQNVRLKIEAPGDESVRPAIAQFLSQVKIGLLEFREARLSLEELFKKMVH